MYAFELGDLSVTGLHLTMKYISNDHPLLYLTVM